MEIKIDRAGLKKYRKRVERRLVLVIPLLLSIFCGLVRVLTLYENRRVALPISDAIQKGLVVFVCSFVLFVLAGYLIAYFSVWRFATIYAESLSVQVSGPYLRIIEKGWLYSDRKIHFNQIMDYSIIQDSDMKAAGIKTLRMNMVMIANNQGRFTIQIAGIESIEEVRDFLAEYDFKHEGS